MITFEASRLATILCGYTIEKLANIRETLDSLPHTRKTSVIDDFLLVSAKLKIAETQRDFLIENPEHIDGHEGFMKFLALSKKIARWTELAKFLKLVIDYNRLVVKSLSNQHITFVQSCEYIDLRLGWLAGSLYFWQPAAITALVKE